MTQHKRQQEIEGDQFYTIARWLVICFLFFLLSQWHLLHYLRESLILWPISAKSNSLVLVFWGYTAFSFFATALLFLPSFHFTFKIVYLFDLIFLSLLTFLSGEQQAIFFLFYFLPLISASVRNSPFISFVSGIIAAIFYFASVIGWNTFNNQAEIAPLNLVSLSLRTLILGFMPWLIASLTEKWTDHNRQKVSEAYQQADLALHEARCYRDQTRSLYRVAQTLSSTIKWKQVLESALQEGQELVPYTVGMVFLTTNEPDEVQLAAGRGFSANDLGLNLMINDGYLAEALLSTSAPRLIDDLSQELDLQTFSFLHNCRSGCLIPLRAEMHVYGVMLFARNNLEPFLQEQLEMLTVIANYAIVALHNAQLLFDLKDERDKTLLKAEQFRQELARDLHDGLAQTLAAIKMNTEVIRFMIEHDAALAIEELERLGALYDQSNYQVRTLLFEIRPLVLETQGLQAALEQYFDRLRITSGSTEIVLETQNIDNLSLRGRVKSELFNIIQESINNALKHAQAQHIWVRLQVKDQTLLTTIQDDGKGFNIAIERRAALERGSFGLLNIDERAKLVNGRAELASSPGKGAIVRIILPIET